MVHAGNRVVNQIKSNQIKFSFYLYSTFLNDFWSSQSAVHIIKKIPYSKDTLQQIQQHSLFRISVWEKRHPLSLDSHIVQGKASGEKPTFQREKWEKPRIKGFHGDIIIIKNCVRSITDSWNAVSAFPLNNLQYSEHTRTKTRDWH